MTFTKRNVSAGSCAPLRFFRDGHAEPRRRATSLPTHELRSACALELAMIGARVLLFGNTPARPLLTDCSVESRCQGQFKQPSRSTVFRQSQCEVCRDALPGSFVQPEKKRGAFGS